MKTRTFTLNKTTLIILIVIFFILTSILSFVLQNIGPVGGAAIGFAIGYFVRRRNKKWVDRKKKK